MAWDLKVPNRVYLGNDGGMYRSDVNGSNDQWTFAISQPFTQFYSVDVSEQDDSRLVGGAQDNGVNRSYGGTSWNSYVGGDGEEALIDPVDQNMVYGCSQYGGCNRSTNGGTSNTDFTSATVSSRRNWFTPVQFDPGNPAVLYYAGDRVNRSIGPRRALVGHQPGPNRWARPRSQLSVRHGDHGGRGDKPIPTVCWPEPMTDGSGSPPTLARTGLG